jgi:hypothetical protein
VILLDLAKVLSADEKAQVTNITAKS